MMSVEALENGADLVADGAIGVEAGGDEDEIGAEPARLSAGHSRAHAECARFIARRRDHAARAAAADGDREPAQLGIVALLDRRIESVHVDMDDLAVRTALPGHGPAL